MIDISVYDGEKIANQSEEKYWKEELQHDCSGQEVKSKNKSRPTSMT
jgi:hypothetical protein